MYSIVIEVFNILKAHYVYQKQTSLKYFFLFRFNC
jgi:hypothetical protein